MSHVMTVPGSGAACVPKSSKGKCWDNNVFGDVFTLQTQSPEFETQDTFKKQAVLFAQATLVLGRWGQADP